MGHFLVPCIDKQLHREGRVLPQVTVALALPPTDNGRPIYPATIHTQPLTMTDPSPAGFSTHDRDRLDQLVKPRNRLHQGRFCSVICMKVRYTRPYFASGGVRKCYSRFQVDPRFFVLVENDQRPCLLKNVQ